MTRPRLTRRQRAAGVAPDSVKASAPLTVNQGRSSVRWVLFLFLALALALVAAALVPAARLPHSMAHAVSARRTDIAFIGVAIAIGVGLSVALLLLLG